MSAPWTGPTFSVKAVRAEQESALMAWAEAMQALISDPEDWQAKVADVLRASAEIHPNGSDLEVACSLMVFLLNRLMAIDKQYWERGTRTDVVNAYRFLRAHRDFLPELVADIPALQ